MMNKLPINSELLRSRLKLKNIAAERKLLASHSSAAKFFAKVKLRPGEIRAHAARLLTSGALASTLLLSAPAVMPPPGLSLQPQTIAPTSRSLALVTPQVLQTQLAAELKALLPAQIVPLSSVQEDNISQVLEKIFGIKAKALLEGNKLPQSYGRMGAEQHLPRYPGDSVWEHKNFTDKGITPGLGGWGYFAYSQWQMTQELSDTEKYYVAVQTLYLPDWKTNTAYLVNWYKYRRVVVVNPANGKVIIAAVADAGPADWTGKHFGGSPEVMAYLGINYGAQNHPVILFFLDDAEKQIPLGPIEYNVITGNPALVNKL